MKNSTLLIVAAVLSLAVIGGCKKKLNLDKFEKVCARVIQCDQNFQSGNFAMLQSMQAGKGKDPKGLCQTALAKMERKKQFSAFVPTLVGCLEQTPCEELKMDVCFSKIIQGGALPSLMPK